MAVPGPTPCSAKSTKKSLVSYLLYIFMFVKVHNLCGNIYLDQFKSNYSVFTSHIYRFHLKEATIELAEGVYQLSAVFCDLCYNLDQSNANKQSMKCLCYFGWASKSHARSCDPCIQ